MAIISDDTVSPDLVAPDPHVHKVTVPPSRPRRRRTGSRSDSGSRKGCEEWMVTPPRLRAVVIRSGDWPLGRGCHRTSLGHKESSPRAAPAICRHGGLDCVGDQRTMGTNA